MGIRKIPKRKHVRAIRRTVRKLLGLGLLGGVSSVGLARQIFIECGGQVGMSVKEFVSLCRYVGLCVSPWSKMVRLPRSVNDLLREEDWCSGPLHSRRTGKGLDAGRASLRRDRPAGGGRVLEYGGWGGA